MDRGREREFGKALVEYMSGKSMAQVGGARFVAPQWTHNSRVPSRNGHIAAAVRAALLRAGKWETTFSCSVL